MVSLTGSIGSGLGSTLTSLLPIAAIGLGAYLLIKNAGFIGKSIGSFAGSGLQNLTAGLSSGFGSGVTQGVNKFGNLVTTPESNAPNTAARVVEQLQLGEYVTQTPTDQTGDTGLTPSQKSGLTFAGFVAENNLGGTINLRTSALHNRYGIQPLDFTFDGSGGINTGRVGLSNATLAAQSQLSKQYGIPTFDTVGNLSTFGGLTTGNPYGNYANPDYPVTS